MFTTNFAAHKMKRVKKTSDEHRAAIDAIAMKLDRLDGKRPIASTEAERRIRSNRSANIAEEFPAVAKWYKNVVGLVMSSQKQKVTDTNKRTPTLDELNRAATEATERLQDRARRTDPFDFNSFWARMGNEFQVADNEIVGFQRHHSRFRDEH